MTYWKTCEGDETNKRGRDDTLASDTEGVDNMNMEPVEMLAGCLEVRISESSKALLISVRCIAPSA